MWSLLFTIHVLGVGTRELAEGLAFLEISLSSARQFLDNQMPLMHIDFLFKTRRNPAILEVLKSSKKLFFFNSVCCWNMFGIFVKVYVDLQHDFWRGRHPFSRIVWGWYCLPGFLKLFLPRLWNTAQHTQVIVSFSYDRNTCTLASPGNMKQLFYFALSTLSKCVFHC